MRRRTDREPAYVLHSYPYKETSLIVEVFSRNRGRLGLLARGARRPRSAIRGVLLASATTGGQVARSLATRLAGARGTEFITPAAATVRGVTRGILGVALIQSLLAGGYMPPGCVIAEGVVFLLLAALVLLFRELIS